MQHVLGSLPAKVGNDIARTALPIMTEARATALANQLHQGCPIPHEVVDTTPDVQEIPAETPPLANGKSNATNRHINRQF